MELLSVGKLQVTLQKVEVHEFTSELTTVLKPIVASHSLELVTELPAGKTYISVDKELMKSLLFNLVDNSIKASNPLGTIRLIVSTVAGKLPVPALVDEHALEDTAADTSTAGIGDAPKEQSEEQGLVKIIVMDTGIGIPAEEIPLITEPFYMLDKARTRKHGGAGLGLALCSEIARAHGTELEIKSIQGRGTAVSILLKKEESDD